MAAKAQEISMEAGSKMAAAMKDVINAAAGLTGFVVESARDLVQYMVRRGQMTQEEADKLIREAEEFHAKNKPAAAKVAAPKPAEPKEAPVKKAAPAPAPPAPPVPKKVAPAAKAPAVAKPAAKAAAPAAKKAPAKAAAKPAKPAPKAKKK
jgi:hypothetical protein